jgi:ankyrin repeat protein
MTRMVAAVGDINCVDKKGRKALMIAVHARRANNMEWLCSEVNVDTKVQDMHGCTALNYAVRKRDISLVRILAPYLDVNIQDNEGQTALMHAADTAKKLMPCNC